MALIPTQLAATGKTVGPNPRIYPDGNDGVRPGDFIAGTDLLPVGMPLARNTSTGFWTPYAQAGANGTGTIRAFVYPDEIQLVAAGEVVGQMLRKGSVHRDDVNTAAIRALCPGTDPTEAELDTALRGGTPSLREMNIEVLGLAGVS